MNYYTDSPYDIPCESFEKIKAAMQTNIPRVESLKEDVVNHPSHYETGKFECIEVMEEALGKEAVKNFCICNAFKYLYRHKNKNGLEDIKKAKWYLDLYIKLSEGE